MSMHGLVQDAGSDKRLRSGSCNVQASALVKRFYAALTSGTEFKDNAWAEWEKHHPADVQAAEAQV